MYDLVIIGGGPAGISAGIYAARKKLRTVIIAGEFSGQSVVSPDIQNWIGEISISGTDLSKKLEDHLKAYAGDTVEMVTGLVSKVEEGFVVHVGDTKYEAKTVLVASGARRRKLNVPGAEEFDQKGLTYCATCDGPLFTDKDVVVIGGGNAGFETASQLLAYVKSVTLLDTGESFKADPITVNRVLKDENMIAINSAITTEILGDKFVTGVKYKVGDEEKILDVEGVFVEIGTIPNTDFIDNVVDLDPRKHIVIDSKNQRSSILGIWAAGDCTDELYHQNNIAAGDAIKAIEDIFVYLKTK